MITSAAGQRLSLGVGGGWSRFYNYPSESYRFHSNFETGKAFAIVLSFDEFTSEDYIPVRFALTLESYEGRLRVGDGGLGYSNRLTADARKTILGFVYFPLNFRFFRNIEINFGIQGSIVLSHKIYGDLSHWEIIYGGSVMDLEDDDSVVKPWSIGIPARLGYSFKITQDLLVTPYYTFYWGLADEFRNVVFEVKTMRHLLGIECSWRF